ncbi:MAG: flavin reductase family protein [Chloroflexi bacterium]|nr:flavin reductase family protein [Chloroflexota bacterium]
MHISPNDLPTREVYKLITGLVVPRPIAWVSSISPDGQPNLAPFSFFNAVCSRPPTLLFCPGVRGVDVAPKDTYNNVKATGEFVVNIVTENLLDAMNITATELPSEINEFELAGLTPAPSTLVKPPLLVESPVNFECRVSNIVPVGDGGKGSAWVVLGEIVYLHIDDSILDENYHVNTRALAPVGRLAGPNYATIGEILSFLRPPSQVPPRQP